MSSADSVGIVGMGAYLPEEVRTNDWWSDEYIAEHLRSVGDDIITGAGSGVAKSSDKEWLQYLASLADDPFRGAAQRRVLPDALGASDMESDAVRCAVANAGMNLSDIDTLITYSILPECPMAGTHALVAHKLGLHERTVTMTVGTACASFVPHLKVAASLIRSREATNVAIVQSNIGSRIADYTKPSSIVVGDGAVACVMSKVENERGLLLTEMSTYGDYFSAVRLAPKATSQSQVPWYRSGTHGSNLVIRSLDQHASKESTMQVIDLCVNICERLLKRVGWRSEQVDHFVASQPVAWFGNICANALGIPIEKTTCTFSEVGHLMPASVGYNLMTAVRSKRISRGDRVLVYSPGAGMVQTAAAFVW